MYLTRLGVLALTYEYSYNCMYNNGDIISFVESIILNTYSYILMYHIHNIELMYSHKIYLFSNNFI